MILMLLCITAFQLIWFGQPKVTRKLGPMMAPVPQWTVAFNLLALTVSWQLKGSTAADPTQCPYFPTGKPDAKVYAPHGPWGNSWEVLRVKNYPQRVVEWAGLAGENILNMGEIGRAETATTALRWELAAPSSQKITVLLFVSFCISILLLIALLYNCNSFSQASTAVPGAPWPLRSWAALLRPSGTHSHHQSRSQWSFRILLPRSLRTVWCKWQWIKIV